MNRTLDPLAPDLGTAPPATPGASALLADSPEEGKPAGGQATPAEEVSGINPEDPVLRRERDALRLQAAAVAAQQAALWEEEARCRQRKQQLEQQEKQLAGHLDEKRRQLLQLRDEVRQAREELQRERQSHAEQVGAATGELARARQEIETSRRQVHTERRRLLELRRRLRQRFHRHWGVERSAHECREVALADRWAKVEQERAALVQERLRFNGDSEVGRRELQDAWQQLHQAEEQFRRRQAEQLGQGRQLDQKAADLARAARQLEGEKRRWQEQHLLLKREAEGLETRVANHRRKLLDQQQEIKRLEAVIATRAVQAGEREAPKGERPLELPPPEAPRPAETPLLVQPEAEAEFRERLEILEQLAGDLADQRLHLAEQGERLLRARQRWQQGQDAAAAGLEAVALRLRDREDDIRRREQALVVEEVGLRRRLDEVVHLRHYLEGCQARLRARVAEWEGERDRLLLEVHDRENLARRRLQSLGMLRGRWEKRRRQELGRVQATLAAGEKLRAEYAALRDRWLARQAELEQKERDLAEQTLALEQYRQEVVGQAPDSPGAEKKLEKLRKRWAALSAALGRALAREREAFRAEKARFEEHHRRLETLARETLARESELAGWQTSWEQEQLDLNAGHEQMRQQLQTANAQRRRCEQQIEELRDEVERVAVLLLEENEAALAPVVGQAA